MHFLPVDQQVIFKVLLLTHKALNNLIHVYIRELLVRHDPPRQLRSSNKYLLQVPKTRFKSYMGGGGGGGDRAFSVAAPSLWNELPQDIKNSPPSGFHY